MLHIQPQGAFGPVFPSEKQVCNRCQVEFNNCQLVLTNRHRPGAGGYMPDIYGLYLCVSRHNFNSSRLFAAGCIQCHRNKSSLAVLQKTDDPL